MVPLLMSELTLTYDFEGVFQERPNRFTIVIRHGSSQIKCHINDTGNLSHILASGSTRVLAVANPKIGLKTSCRALAAIGPDGTLTIIDSTIPNRFFERSFHIILSVDPFTSSLRKEFLVPGGRIDFAVYSPKGLWLVEVKGVNLSVNGLGLFPSAPSTRAYRHLESLALLARRGFKTSLVFIALRGDIKSFAPNRRVDRRFASLLCSLAETGIVDIVGVKIHVSLDTDEKLVKMGYKGLGSINC